MGQHHSIVFGSSQIGIDFCMSGIMMASQVDGFFVKCIGNSSVNFSFHGQLNHLGNIAEGSVTAFCGYLAALQLGGVNQPHIENINGSKAKEGIRDILNPMNL